MILRLATERDGDPVAAIYRPAVVDGTASFELDPPNGAAMAARIAATLERTPWIVCEGADGVLGYAYAGRHRDRPAYRWSTEVSAYVRPDAQRRGIAAALYTSLLGILALQGFHNAYAGITLPNDASVRLHEALGFARVGVFQRVGYKFGAWHDVLWLGRGIAGHPDDPREPVPIAALRGTAVLDAAVAAGLPRIRAI